jgi:predicted transcriptional regulator
MGTVRMTITLDDELWRKISHLAVEKRVSKNNLIIQAIKEFLERQGV